jgi:hypothetical protein
MMKIMRKDAPLNSSKAKSNVFAAKNKPAFGKKPRPRALTPQEQTIKLAKSLLTQGHHLQHKQSLETLCTALNGSGRTLIQPHFTPSPLSSASLLASLLKHRLIRNQESVTSQVIRKIVDLADSKNSVWSHSSSQLAKKIQYSQTLERLRLKLEALQLRLAQDPKDSELAREVYELECIIRKTETIVDYLEPTVSGNLHPDSLLSGDKVSMTPSEAAQLPSPTGTIRGVLVRIKGPRKGNRALKQQKSSGRVSINSIGYVNYEDCNLQIPSKLGIYGLYIRLVYSKIDRLISPYNSLPVFGAQNFKLKNIT